MRRSQPTLTSSSIGSRAPSSSAPRASVAAALDGIGEHPKAYVIEMSEVPVLDSSAAATIAASRRAARHGARVVIAGAARPVRRTLLLHGVAARHASARAWPKPSRPRVRRCGARRATHSLLRIALDPDFAGRYKRRTAVSPIMKTAAAALALAGATQAQAACERPVCQTTPIIRGSIEYCRARPARRAASISATFAAMSKTANAPCRRIR